MPLEDFKKKIQVLQEFDIKAVTIEIINENSELLADLLAQQLSQGRDGNKEKVLLNRRNGTFDFYSDYTVFHKEKFGSGFGKVTEYVTNYFSGAFYKEMFVRTEGENFFIESKVPYFDAIIRQSGEVIMKLNEDHLRYFTEEILVPQIKSRFSTLWNGV